MSKQSRSKSRSPQRSNKSHKSSPASKMSSARSSSGQSRTDTPPKSTKSTKSSKSRASRSPASRKNSSLARQESTQSLRNDSSAPMKKSTIIAAKMEAQGLRVIDMSGQGMTSLQGSLFSRQNVGFLDLSSNNLRSIPPEINKLRTLVQIDVSKNSLRCNHPQDFHGLPDALASLSNLEDVNISECNLPFIPPAIWQCQNLRRLNVSRNKINVLFPEVGQLYKLVHLNAQQTNIVTLPPEIAFCQDLEELLLWGNVLESLPETLKEMPKLHTLAINHRSFAAMVDSYMENLLRKGQIESEHIPPVLFEMPALTILDLEYCRINSLPETCQAPLVEFHVSNNFFLRVPPIILGMSTLKVLDLSHNQLVEVPPNLSKLTTLEVLKLSHNSLIDVPVELGLLANLQELAIGCNRLSTIPSELGQLTKLKTLTLEENEINVLPNEITNLAALETLDLTGNLIQTLPMSFHKLQGLRSAHSYNKYTKYGLWLHKNPLETPPPEVWKTDDPTKIFRYLKKLQIIRTENLQRQKLIVLGNSQSGKTSLINTMVTGKSILTKEDEATQIADFTVWNTENFVDFLVMDLGGDSAYHSLHPMLMDPKALHMVMFDLRAINDDSYHEVVGHWLELLQVFAPGAVIKLVGTHADLCYPDIAEKSAEQVKTLVQTQLESSKEKLASQLMAMEQKLQAALKAGQPLVYAEHLQHQIKRMHALLRLPLRIDPVVATVSSAPGIVGVLDLISQLELMAVNTDLFGHAQRVINDTWTSLRKNLKIQKDLYLPLDKVRQIALDCEVSPEELKAALLFLKDVGEILWFPTVPNLKDKIFHRPRYIIEVLRGLFFHDSNKVLNFHKNRIFVSKGKFEEDTFEIAKEAMLNVGHISRPLLQCLWFYLRLDHESLEHHAKLVSMLDLAYGIPQPYIPPHRTEFIPLFAVPALNQDDPTSDQVHTMWPEPTPAQIQQLQVKITFPAHFPSTVFGKLASRIQDMLDSRIDWRHVLLASAGDTEIRIAQNIDLESLDCILDLTVRSHTLELAQDMFAELHRHLVAVLGLCPGLVWYPTYSSSNVPSELSLEQCFPKQKLH